MRPKSQSHHPQFQESASRRHACLGCEIQSYKIACSTSCSTSCRNPPTPTDGKGERIREAITSSKGQQQQMARSKQQEARKATALEVEKENARCKSKQATEQEARSKNAKDQE